MINFTFGNNNFQTVAGSNGFCLGKVGFLAPVRDIETIAIPGGNMVLTRDNGGWKTTSGKYQCFIQSGYGEKIQAVQEWLSQIGFQRLEDTEDTTHFREAIFRGPIEEVKVLHNDIARFDVTFECKPGRWLKSGETTQTMTAAGTITNPTSYDALPLIRIDGSGDCTLTVNGKTVTLTDNFSGITLDSATQRAYNDYAPKDSGMTGDFPVLIPGVNTISWTGSGVTQVKITPRWWEL